MEHIRGFGDYALYKSTFYLLTYLHISLIVVSDRLSTHYA